MNQTDLERERYEARRKWQLDYNTGMKVARMEGKQEGLEEGLAKGREQGREEGRKDQKIAIIQFCQRLLARLETPTEELMGLSLEELTRLAENLQEEVQKER